MSDNKQRHDKVRAKHGKDAGDAMIAVEKAVLAATPQTPEARFKAGILQVLENAKVLKNPHEQSAAEAHFVANLDGFIDLCQTGVPKAEA